jgi:ribonuclease HII
VAAAVILPSRSLPIGINDSKRLTEGERERLYSDIVRTAVAFGVGLASEQEIDALNILQATKVAMRRALEALYPQPDYLLLDAMYLPGVLLPQRAVIKGDALSLSIAAASILAKVTRDRLMGVYHAQYPEYDFASHKGYPTPLHLARLAQYGPCPIHRRSFSPVRALSGFSHSDSVSS